MRNNNKHTVKEILTLKNVYFTFKEEMNSENYRVKFKPYGVDDIEKMTIIYYRESFTPQQNEITNRLIEEKSDLYNFYIMKYDKILLIDDLYEFLLSKQEEKFILCKSCEANSRDIKAFVESEVNNLKVTLFTHHEDGHYHKIAELRNRTGEPVWGEIKILSDLILSIEEESENRYHMEMKDLLVKYKVLNESDNGYYSSYSKKDFKIFGESSLISTNTTYTMNQYVKISGKTRILCEYGRYDDAPRFGITVGERALADLNTRYGFDERSLDGYNWGEPGIHTEDKFPEADLDKETKERIYNSIKDILLNKKGNMISGTYYNPAEFQMTAKIVISEPVAKHRRPTFHYIVGFENGGAIDIVELARGELLMKDMTPATVYYLNKDGSYVRTSHRRYGETRNMIVKEGIIDLISLTTWSEEKSLHPELLKAVIEYQDKLGLDMIRKFNRIPFGALFIEQLVKANEFNLATEFTNYINGKADNMNYHCNSLQDLLPGCNPDGTSVLKVLNMNKVSYELLQEIFHEEKYSSNASEYMDIYRTIKTICPSGVLTKKDIDLIRKYTSLRRSGSVKYTTSSVTKVDLIDYPEEIKILHKMFIRIAEKFKYEPDKIWDARRRYTEIVEVYFKLKDYGWDPADYMVFIEFGINGDNAYEELCHRETAANTALKIYKDKLDEAARKKVEESFKARTSALKKLESKKPKKGDTTSWFNKYIVIKPTQIYGEDVVGSIEKEGADQRHCVFRQYANDVASGSYTVMYLRYKDSPEEALVTIGITKEGRINQTYTVNDDPITNEQALAIIEWANSKKGLVTFKSEHTNVKPGGWTRGNIEVPNLPEPDVAWLKKLADTSKKPIDTETDIEADDIEE